MNHPVPMTREDLVFTLRRMADLVEVGDSWEGSIEYCMPTDEALPGPEANYTMVRAAFRIGNQRGQGGMTIIGSSLPPLMRENEDV